MTRDQLLAMPDSDYMSDSQLTYFRDILLADMKAAHEAINQARAEFSERRTAPDESDWATNEQERSLLMESLDRNQRSIKTIQLALDAIADGEYGVCQSTGEPIGLRRLLLNPTTTLSIDAMRLKEARDRILGTTMRGAA